MHGKWCCTISSMSTIIMMSSWPTLASCKSLKVVTILSVMSSTIVSEDARDGDPAVRQIRPVQVLRQLFLHLFKTCRATQELKIVFHIFTSIYTSLIPQQVGRPLCCLWLVLKYLWMCNLNLPAQSRLFDPERHVVVGEWILVVWRDLYLVWMTLQQGGQR
jgi:hypothetical protein